MSNIVFISYRRVDRASVEQLELDLKELDFDVWFDRRLSGGQPWWDKILQSIRQCDYFIVTLSPHTAHSEACKLERDYARRLGKSILPVLIADTEMTLFEPELGKLQAVDFRQRNNTSLLLLSKAIYQLQPSPPLPAELPEEPPVPGSYLNEVKDLINKPDLQFAEQYQALGELKKAIHTEDDPNSAVLPLLKRLRERPDLSMQVAREIDELSQSLGVKQPQKQADHKQVPPNPKLIQTATKKKTTITPLVLFIGIGVTLLIIVSLCCIIFYAASLSAGSSCDVYGNCY